MFNTLVLVEIFLKFVCVAWVIRWWLIHSRDSHAGRLARVITIVFLGAILLPVATIALPKITLAIVPYGVWLFFQRDTDFFISHFWVGAITLYFLVFFIQLFVWLHAHIDFRSMMKHATPCALNAIEKMKEIERKASKKLHAEILTAPVSGPFTYGVLRSIIILPQNYTTWSDARLLRVLAHESAHVARRDWFWKNTIDVMAMILWCIPGVSYLKSRFEWYIEMNADDGVLALDSNRLEYANDMLAFANCERSNDALEKSLNDPAIEDVNKDSEHYGAVLSIISGSYCYERIAAVLDGSRHRACQPYQDSSKLSVLLAVVIWAAIALVSLGPAQSRALLESDLAVTGWVGSEWFGSRLLGKVELDMPLKGAESSNFHDPSVGYSTLIGCSLIGSPKPIQASIVQAEPYFEELVITSYPSIPTVELPKTALLAGLKQDLSWDLSVAPVLPSVMMQGNIAVRSVTPEYPRLARKKKIEGKVIAQFSILPNGQASDIRIAMAAPDHVFNQSVIKAIKASRFRPTQKEGRFVKTPHASQIFTFSLSSKQPAEGYKPKLGQPIKTATLQ